MEEASECRTQLGEHCEGVFTAELEGVLDPQLGVERDHLHSAPLLGKHDTLLDELDQVAI